MSTKLVKFLSPNTQVEAVDKLEAIAGELLDSFKEITRTVVAQVKTTHSGENKHYALKKAAEAMCFRLEK